MARVHFPPAALDLEEENFRRVADEIEEFFGENPLVDQRLGDWHHTHHPIIEPDQIRPFVLDQVLSEAGKTPARQREADVSASAGASRS